MYSDFLLIRKMKQGDDTAFDIFVHRYYRKILIYCHYHCSCKAYAEDLTQETFVRFFTKLSDYHYRGKTLNYLYTIAGNLCKDHLKKIKEIPMEEIEVIEEKKRAEYQMENVIEKIFMEQALRQLPGELSEVLTLYYFQGLKLTEISDTLHIGLPLVKYRLRRAKKQLKRIVGKEKEYEAGRKNRNIQGRCAGRINRGKNTGNNT